MPLSLKVLRFAVVGVSTAALYYALLYGSVEALGVNATLASSLVYVLVLGFNYLMHHSWTFSQSTAHTHTLSRYLVMVFCGFLLNAVIMYGGVSLAGLNYLLVQGAAMFSVIVWNFSVSLLWVFRS
jgi:putative flippase GtrA